ncbi:alpha/beta fold hydrolase [Paenibacillus tarimensis]
MNEHSIANHIHILAGGHELAYYDSGMNTEHGSRTAVLLHGYCGSSAYWSKVVPLLETTCRVIAPDLRGHGSSDAPKEDIYSMESFAEDVLGLLNGLGIDRACLIGHSLGGYVTLAAAERDAERFNGLSLVHSTSYPDVQAAKENRDKAVRTIKMEGIRVFADGLVPKLFAPAHVTTMGAEVQRIKEIGYHTSQHAAAAAALGMKERPDRGGVLRSSHVPVLLVAGASDQLIPPERTFSAAGENIRTHLLERSGHMGMIEEPEALAQTLTQFVLSLEVV